MTADMKSNARAAGDHPAVEAGARLGFLANGLLHLLIAWLALQVAWGGDSGNADQTGALSVLAESGLGTALLWGCVVGFVLLALWQVTEAIGRHETKDRLKAVGRLVVYGALGWTTFSLLQGSGGGSSEESMTAKVLQWPLGQVLIAAVGLGVIGVAVYHVIKGWKKKFLEDLDGHPGRAVVRAGQVGYIAKGIALVIVGGFLVVAAVTHDSDEATGLDGALRSLLELPFGAVLLTLMAIGFAAYGVYSFARAKYARV